MPLIRPPVESTVELVQNLPNTFYSTSTVC